MDGEAHLAFWCRVTLRLVEGLPAERPGMPGAGDPRPADPFAVLEHVRWRARSAGGRGAAASRRRQLLLAAAVSRNSRNEKIDEGRGKY